MRGKIVSIALVILLGVTVWWVHEGPRKDLTTDLQWSTDIKSRREVPLFWIFYRWNGVKEKNPHWMIFPRNEKWWIVDLNKVMHSGANDRTPESIRKLTKQYREEFTSSWIRNQDFDPEASRGEVLMTALGFQISFDSEKQAFYSILGGTKDFDTGRLHPASSASELQK